MAGGIGYHTGSGDQNPVGGQGGGGGGASVAGADITTTADQAGAGGTGLSNSIRTGSGVFYAGGGGGGRNVSGTPNAGGNGGGGAGGVSSGVGVAGSADTGGGGGGHHGATTAGVGGTGIVVIRYLASALTSYNDITLQSTDTAAEAAPTKADMVMLMEDSAGTATINTDIKGYVSRDSGSTFIEGVLVDEGDWGTNKRILAFHDLSFTGASGTDMCYKITTHNQAAAKQTKIHATSIGWK